MDISDEVLVRKQDYEGDFCASVFINPDTARKEVGWLEPGTFTNTNFRAFWKFILEGKHPMQAAIDSSVYEEIVQRVGRLEGAMVYRGLAGVISDENYNLDISTKLPHLAVAIKERNQQKVQTIIDQLGSAKPASGDIIKTAHEASYEFCLWLNSDPQKRGLFTRIKPLDDALGGIDKATLTVVAGRPSMGKTALAWQFARTFAKEEKFVLYVSPEMSARQLWARAACGALEIDIRSLRSGQVPIDTIERIEDISAELAETYGDRLMIYDDPRVDSAKIWALTAKYTPDVLLVDHMGLVNDAPKNDTLLKLNHTSWTGKQIAKEFDIPVIYLHQLSRGNEYRDNKKPTLKDLRGSGNIEENADNVIFIHSEDYYKDPSEKPADYMDVDLIVAKFRDGARDLGIHVKYELLKQWFVRKDY